jgi:hypothetical protein
MIWRLGPDATVVHTSWSGGGDAGGVEVGGAVEVGVCAMWGTVRKTLYP